MVTGTLMKPISVWDKSHTNSMSGVGAVGKKIWYQCAKSMTGTRDQVVPELRAARPKSHSVLQEAIPPKREPIILVMRSHKIDVTFTPMAEKHWDWVKHTKGMFLLV